MVFGTVWCQAILFLSLSLWYVCSYGQCSMAVGWLPSRLAKDAGMYVCVCILWYTVMYAVHHSASSLVRFVIEGRSSWHSSHSILNMQLNTNLCGINVSVFSCPRLLYSPHGVFVSDSDHKLLEGESGRKKGLKDTAVLLCPNGQVVSFSVPFPALAR